MSSMIVLLGITHSFSCAFHAIRMGHSSCLLFFRAASTSLRNVPRDWTLMWPIITASMPTTGWFSASSAIGCANEPIRSEEHTSELQSLMRISYAVFCLKKKNTLHVLLTHIQSNESNI